MGGAAGFGVTAGAHRLWTHRSYKAKLPLQIILLILYSAAGMVITFFKLFREYIYIEVRVVIRYNVFYRIPCSTGLEIIECIISIAKLMPIPITREEDSFFHTWVGSCKKNIRRWYEKEKPLIWAISQMIHFWHFTTSNFLYIDFKRGEDNE